MVQAVLYWEKGDWLISICESFYIKDTFDFFYLGFTISQPLFTPVVTPGSLEGKHAYCKAFSMWVSEGIDFSSDSFAFRYTIV